MTHLHNYTHVQKSTWCMIVWSAYYCCRDGSAKKYTNKGSRENGILRLILK